MGRSSYYESGAAFEELYGCLKIAAASGREVFPGPSSTPMRLVVSFWQRRRRHQWTWNSPRNHCWPTIAFVRHRGGALLARRVTVTERSPALDVLWVAQTEEDVEGQGR